MITLIACIDAEYGIGFKGSMPWPKLDEDMKNFRRVTEGRNCLAGHRTFNELKFLPGRTWINYNTGYDESEVIVVGGQKVYHDLISKADEIWLTVIHNKVYECDRYFPKFNPIPDYMVKDSNVYLQDDLVYSITHYIRLAK